MKCGFDKRFALYKLDVTFNLIYVCGMSISVFIVKCL